MMLVDKVKTAGQSYALEGGDQRGTRQTNGRCGSGKVADIDWVPEIEIISEPLSWGVVAPLNLFVRPSLRRLASFLFSSN
jgi:hypothetical protein